MIRNPLARASFVSLVLACGTLAACGGNGGGGDEDKPTIKIDTALLENFADNVLLPTYTSLAANAATMTAAVTTLQATPSATTLAAARDAWVATRAPWEQSEGFLFGPVDANGYDPAIDSWPLNKTDLNLVLASNKPLTAAAVAGFDDTQKGFHTVEFLIYGEDSDKAVSAFTSREFEYLIGSSKALQDVADLLVASWNDGIEDAQAFRTTFVTAGQAGNTVYPSLTAAGEEIVKGMIGICDEVADGKIATPFDARDPNLVESQFSFNSLQDFSDNMRSVQNVWLGFAPGKTAVAGASLSERVALRDAELDARVKAEITAAIDAILAIPSPFPVSLQDPANAATITNAQEQIRVLRNTLQQDILPFIAE